MTDQQSTVVGVFDDRKQADRAMEELRTAGFREEQMGFAAQGTNVPGADLPGGDKPEGAIGEDGTGAHTEKTAAAGAALGGVLGAAAGLLIPAIGPFIAGGILATVLGSAALGAAGGGLLGALVSMGVPEEEIAAYQRELQASRTLVMVQAGPRAQEATNILHAYGAHDLSREETPEVAQQRLNEGQ